MKVVQSWTEFHEPYSPWNSPGQNIGVGSRSLLQGIFPTQVSNPGFPHCRPSLYCPGHQGSPTSTTPLSGSINTRMPLQQQQQDIGKSG